MGMLSLQEPAFGSPFLEDMDAPSEAVCSRWFVTLYWSLNILCRCSPSSCESWWRHNAAPPPFPRWGAPLQSLWAQQGVLAQTPAGNPVWRAKKGSEQGSWGGRGIRWEGREGPWSEFDSIGHCSFFQSFIKHFLFSRYNTIDCFQILLSTHSDLCGET